MQEEMEKGWLMLVEVGLMEMEKKMVKLEETAMTEGGLLMMDKVTLEGLLGVEEEMMEEGLLGVEEMMGEDLLEVEEDMVIKGRMILGEIFQTFNS